MMLCSCLVKRLQIDDPLDAFSVHAGGGPIGLLLTLFFWQEKGLLFGNFIDGGGCSAAKMLGK